MSSHDTQRSHRDQTVREFIIAAAPCGRGQRGKKRSASKQQEGNVVRVRYRLGCVMNFTFTQQAP